MWSNRSNEVNTVHQEKSRTKYKESLNLMCGRKGEVAEKG
jgi:hypothetical protein